MYNGVMRLFIAAALSEEQLDWVGRCQFRLKQALARSAGAMRWTTREQWHITLQFLGDCEETLVVPVGKTLDAVTEARPPFRLSLQSLGTFASRHGGVLWLGVEEGRQALTELAAALQKKMMDFGIVPESRPYHAHLTLARSRERFDARLLQKCSWPEDPSPASRIDRLTLFASTLGSGGASYESLGESIFGTLKK